MKKPNLEHHFKIQYNINQYSKHEKNLQTWLKYLHVIYSFLGGVAGGLFLFFGGGIGHVTEYIFEQVDKSNEFIIWKLWRKIKIQYRWAHQFPRQSEAAQCAWYPVDLWSGYIDWEIEVARWLRWRATNHKFAGSIPDDVNGIFHWHIPTDHTMALGSNEPIKEMNTRHISWG